MRDVYELDSPDYYVPVLRYLYGLPLCAEGEHMGALALKGMRDAAEGFEIPHLQKHALNKLEELLNGHLRVGGVRPPTGEPLPVGYQDTSIGPFLFELDAMEVAVKVCCGHLEILRQFPEFHDRCPSKLYRNMLFYDRDHGRAA
jgi:hypothetical protein